MAGAEGPTRRSRTRPGGVALSSPSFSEGSALRSRCAPPDPMPARVVGITTHQSFDINRDNQIGCDNPYDPASRDSLWSQLLEKGDPVGASWGRAFTRGPGGGDSAVPQRWGPLAAQLDVPTLLISGEKDRQVAPENMRALYADLNQAQRIRRAGLFLAPRGVGNQSPGTAPRLSGVVELP